MEKNFPFVFSSPSFGFNQDFNEDTIIPMSSTTVVEENQYKNDHSSLIISMDDRIEEDHKGFHRKYILPSLINRFNILLRKILSTFSQNK